MPSYSRGVNPRLRTAGQSKNPIKNLLNRSKERKKRIEEEAAKAITNNRAGNEQKIIAELESINFISSRLSPEQLDFKTDPSQPHGDLEYARDYAVHLLKNSPNISVDISAIDEKLLVLVKSFKNAVIAGDSYTAFSTKAFILIVIKKIRNQVPLVKADLVQRFIEDSSQYADTLIYIADRAQELDKLNEVTKNSKANYEGVKADFEKKRDSLRRKLDDPEYREIFSTIENRTAEDTEGWSEKELDVRNDFNEMYLKRTSIKLSYATFDSQRKKILRQQNQLDILKSKVAVTPIPTDPNSENKFQSELESITNDIAETDTAMKELIETYDRLDGILESMNNAPGNRKLIDSAAKETERFFEDLKKEQEIEAKRTQKSYTEFMNSHGIRSKEQQEEFIKQQEAQMNAQLDTEEIRSVNDVTEMNYIEE